MASLRYNDNPQISPLNGFVENIHHPHDLILILIIILIIILINLYLAPTYRYILLLPPYPRILDSYLPISIVVHYKGTDTPIYRYTDIRDSLPSPSLPSHLPYSTLSRTPINSFFFECNWKRSCPSASDGQTTKQYTVHALCIHVHNIHIHVDNSAALRWPLVVSRHEAWPPREAGVRPSPRLSFFVFLRLRLPLPFIIVSFVTTVR